MQKRVTSAFCGDTLTTIYDRTAESSPHGIGLSRTYRYHVVFSVQGPIWNSSVAGYRKLLLLPSYLKQRPVRELPESNTVVTIRYAGGSRMPILDVPRQPPVASGPERINAVANSAVWYWHYVTPASVCRERKLTSDVVWPAENSKKWTKP